MSNLVPLVLSCLGGVLLGAFFFGGLWWTIQKDVSSDKSGLWFLGSLLLRTGTIVFGFYWIARGHPSRHVACLMGFLIARVILVKWLTRTPATVPSPREGESIIAP